MNIISTLLCRELRRKWPFLVVFIIPLFLYFSYHSVPADNGGSLTSSSILGFIAGAWTVIIFATVHEAPPSGSSEFWMTRPISGSQLFVAKIISIFLICVLAPALALSAAKMAGLVQNGWIQTSREYLSVYGLMRVLFIMALGLTLVASVSRNIIQYIIGLCSVGIVFGFLILYSTGKAGLRLEKGYVFQYQPILEWTLIAIYTAGVLFIIHRQYARRNRVATLASCVLLGLVLYGIWHCWPVIPRV